MSISTPSEGLSKQARVKTGCLICRRRKVKCDETPGRCMNCSKLSLNCQWQNELSGQSGPAIIPPLRPSACIACRLARTRCSHDRPTCLRCSEYRIECEYPTKRKRHTRPSAEDRFGSSSTPPIGGVDQVQPQIDAGQSSAKVQSAQEAPEWLFWNSPNVLGSVDLPAEPPVMEEVEPQVMKSAAVMEPLPIGERLERLVGAYFLHVHPYQANAFLHRTTVLQSLQTGDYSEMILLAICAISARFVDPPETSAKAWAETAATSVLLSGSRSIDTVITAILLATHAFYSGAFKRAETFSAIAVKQALSLHLHRDNEEHRPWVEAEMRRRVFFACYCLERLLSNGSEESTLSVAHRIKVQLPCDGISYRLGIKTETPVPILERSEAEIPSWLYQNVGTLGQYIRLIGIRHMIQRYLYDIAEDIRSQPFPWEDRSPFSACIEKLAAFRTSLTGTHRLTPEAIAKRYDAPIFGALVMIYLWWNACHIKLYRLALPGYPQSLDDSYLVFAPLGWIAQSQESALRHAKAITALLEMVSNHITDKSFTIRDPYLAQLVYVSIRVQLEALPTGNKPRPSFDVALGFVERAARLFEPARHICREIRALMLRHGVIPSIEIPQFSRVGSPNPIFDAQLDTERITQSALGIPESVIPPEFGDAWESGWTPDLGLIFGVQPIPAASTDYTLTNAPERWQGQISQVPAYGIDPFLPDLPPIPQVHEINNNQPDNLDSMANWLAPLIEPHNSLDPEVWMNLRWAGA